MRERSEQETITHEELERVASSRPEPCGVLVIENDPDLQWRLARTLTVQGNRVVGTASGDGALALLANWQVDLVLVAEDLPGADGLEVARRIRERSPGVRVILMTSEDHGPDIEVAARLAGAAACLAKPFGLEALLSLVNTVLSAPAGEPLPAE